MDTIRNNSSLFLCVLVFGFVMCNHIIAEDTISAGASITGKQTITSKGENFELGFFKPGTHSQNHYIGIWYKFSVQTVVWVANRDVPILDPYSSKFKLSDGNLVLFSKENQTPIWSTNLSSNTLNKTQLILGDDGNLVLRDGSNPSDVIWQSFDHPTDTLLPGLKFGFNKKTNRSQKLISWRSAENPATGFYNLQSESNGANQYFLYGNNSDQIWNTGEWDEESKTFPSIPGMRLSSLFNFSCISNVNESYFTYSVYNDSIINITRIVINLTGQIQQLTWSDKNQNWILIWYQPSIPVAVSTAEGRKRKAIAWKIIVPVSILMVTIMGVSVYIYLTKIYKTNIRGIWKGFKRVSTNLFKSKASYNSTHRNMFDDGKTKGETHEELQMFNLDCLSLATNNFCWKSKLGEGGFGPVYKGTLTDGQEIAVKRLSAYSGQGDEEFKNEVALLIKLQHKNLVRLLGFCLDGDEKLLVYEFMKYGSLDQFLFDPIKRTQLDWGRRHMIIEGIAKGLLYLHEDSRLNIIHRDLKASNVLLGADMVPKIADFGMARIFKENQYQDSTKHICGTLGYMAPEYAMLGKFSIKSDAFSFGVLTLEILCGKRSNSFGNDEDAETIFTYAWKLWNEGKYLELLDSTLRENHSTNEVMRCIEIALLCVQEDAAERPTMARIVHILNKNCSVTPAAPLAPPAFSLRDKNKTETNTHSQDAANYVSVNEMSVTELYPR